MTYIETDPIETDPIEMIANERFSQKEDHGYTDEHDDQYKDGELAYAACCSIDAVVRYKWPWGDRPSKADGQSRIKQLVVAGALIVAEIERLQRAGEKQ